MGDSASGKPALGGSGMEKDCGLYVCTAHAVNQIIERAHRGQDRIRIHAAA
ncbi:MAG: hypothetical protein KGJ94_00310 [Xanthomonadaceae bacterium]|nr:hypothetical protein [Xanthomonadaceae bacterium]